MAAPRLTLEAVVDFILKADKVDDTAVVKKIQKTLGDLKLPPLSITPEFKLNTQSLSKQVQDDLKKALKTVDKGLSDISEKVQDRMAKEAVAKGKQPDATAIENAGKQAEAQLSSLRGVYKQMLDVEEAQRAYVDRAGKTMSRDLKLLQQLSSGKTTLENLKKAGTLGRVQDTAAFIQQRAAMLKQLQRDAAKLGKMVEGPEKITRDAESGEETGRYRERIPGVPVLVPELAKHIDQLERMGKANKEALDPKLSAEYGKAQDVLQKKLRSLSGTMLATSNVLKKADGTPIFTQASKDLELLKGSLDDLRTRRKGLGEIESISDRSREAKKLYKEAEAFEKLARKYREGTEKQIADHRSKEMGHYLKNAAEISRSAVSQVDALAGERLLKGATTPKLAVEGVKDVQGGKEIAEALRHRIAGLSGELVGLSKGADLATLATNKIFAGKRAAVEDYNQLLASTTQKVKDLTYAATPAGQKKVLDQAAKQELKVGGQETSLAELDKNLSSVRDTLKDPSMAGAPLDDLNNRLGKLSKARTDLATQLSETSVLGDPDERERALNKATADINNLTKQVKGLGKESKEAARKAAVAYEKGRIVAGQELLEQYPDEGRAVRSIKNADEMSKVVAALGENHRTATEALNRYTVATGDTAGQTAEFSRLNAEVEKTGAHHKAANKELERLNRTAAATDIGPTQEVIDRAINQTKASANSAQAAVTALRDSAAKKLTGKELEGTTDLVDKYSESLERLKKQADAAYAPHEGLADQKKGLDEVNKGMRELASQAVTTQKALNEAYSVRQAEGRRVDLERGRAEVDAAQVRGEDALRRLAGRDVQPGLQGLPALALAVPGVGLGQTADVREAYRSRKEDMLAELDVAEKRLGVGEKQTEQDRRAADYLKERRKQVESLSEEMDAQAAAAELAAKKTTGLDKEREASNKQFKKAYGIDKDVIDSILHGTDESVKAMDQHREALHARQQGMVKDMGKAAAEGSKEYKKLGSQIERLDADIGKAGKAATSLRKIFSAEGGYARDQASVDRVVSERFAAGQRMVEQAGGAEALSRTLRGVPRADRTPEGLGPVKEYLAVQEAQARAELNRLTAEGVDRQSEGYKKAAKEAGVLNKAIGRVNNELRGHVKLTQQVGNLFKRFAQYGIGYAAMYQVLAAMKKLIGGVVELDTALISIRAVIQATNKQMMTIENSIKRVALATRFSTGEIAAAGQVLAQAGVTAKEFPEALSAVAYFASATESSMQISADLLSTMRNVFKELDDIQIANQLTQAVNISKLTAADLKTVLSLSSQMAKSYQLTSDQYLSAVSTLRNAGIKASTVATGLRQSLIEIFAPDTKTIKVLSKRYAELGEPVGGADIRQRFFGFSQREDPMLAVLTELKRLGFTGAGKATFAGRTFDVRAENAINGLINNLDEYVQSQAQIVFGNPAITASMTQMESLSASTKNLGAALVATTHDITADALPAIENFIDALTDAVVGIGDFDSKMRQALGTGVEDILYGAAAGGLLAAKSAPTGTTGWGVAGRTVVGTIAGGLASSQAADYLAENADLTSGQATVTTVASGAIGASLIFGKQIIKYFGGIGKNIKSGAGLVLSETKKASGILSKFKAIASTVASFSMKALSFTPWVGWFIRGASAAWLIYETVSALLPQSDAQKLEQAAAQAKEANKRVEKARAKAAQLRSQVKGYKPSKGAFIADSAQFAGATEDMREKLDAVNKEIIDFFSITGGTVEEEAAKIGEIKNILRQLATRGVEAGSPARTDLLRILGEEAGISVLGDKLLESRVRFIQESLSDIENKVKGRFKSLKESLDRYKQSPSEEREGSIEGALEDALREAVEEVGLERHMADLADATAEQVVAVSEKLLEVFNANYQTVKDFREAMDSELKEVALDEDALIKEVLLIQGKPKVRERVEAAVSPAPTEEGMQDIQRIRGKVIAARTRKLADYIWEPTLSSFFTSKEELKRKATQVTDNTSEFIDVLTDMTERIIELSIASRDREFKKLAVGLLDFQQLEVAAERGDPAAVTALESFQKKDPEIVKAIRESTYDATRFTEADEKLAKESRLFQEGVTESGLITAFIATELKDFFKGLKSPLQNIKAVVDEQLTFQDSDYFRASQRRLAQLEVEIKDLERKHQYNKIDVKLNEKQKILLGLLNQEEAFYRKQLKDADAGKRLPIQRKLDQITLRRIRLEPETEDVISKNRLDTIEEAQKRAKKSIDLLTKVAEDMASVPFFSDYEGLKEKDVQLQQYLENQLQALKDLRDAGGLEEKDYQLQKRAFEAASGSIWELAKVFDKAAAATKTYIDVVKQFSRADIVTDVSQLPEAYRRRTAGITEPVDERMESIVAQMEVNDLAAKSQLQSIQQQRELLAEAKKALLAGDKGAADSFLSAAAGIATTVQGVQDLIDTVTRLQEEVRAVSGDIQGQLAVAFDMQGIMSTLRTVMEDGLRALDDDIRNIFATLFTDLSTGITDALFSDLEEGTSAAEHIDSIVENFATNLAKRITEAYVQKGLFSLASNLLPDEATDVSENGTNLLKELLGFDKTIKAAKVDIKAAQVNVSGAGVPLPAAAADSSLEGMGEAFIGPPVPSSLETPTIPGTPTTEGAGLVEEQSQEGFFSSVLSGFGKFFTSLGTGMTTLFSGLGSSLTGILNAILPGAGDLISTGLSWLGGVMGFKRGGLIKGPGTSTSDSIPGVVIGADGKAERGIAVSNDEAILNGEAVQALGVPFINYVNSHADKLANGGMVSFKKRVGQAGGSIMSQSTSKAQGGGTDAVLKELAEAVSGLSGDGDPSTLSLEVSDSALHRTLRDYLEDYFADVLATR